MLVDANNQIPELNDGQAQTFRDTFKFVRELANGTEGIVSRWEDRNTGQTVAVKLPRKGYSQYLQEEIVALRKIPPHDHIVRLLTYDQNWVPVGPALVFELADLGDVHSYRALLLLHYSSVPEITLWKFLRDMSLGLDWIHNHLGEPHIHGDLKPANILVFSPPGWHSKDVTTLPTFKICYVSRLKPISEDVHSATFRGTYEFGPPQAERCVRQTPKVDVYSIGASIQFFALGIWPIMSNDDFVALKTQAGETVPSKKEMESWDHPWRAEIPPAYRPLDCSVEFQKDVLKLERPVQPYSSIFNAWYDRLMEVEPSKRISSKILAKGFVPLADSQFRLLQEKGRWQAARLRHEESSARYEASRRRAEEYYRQYAHILVEMEEARNARLLR